MHLLTINQVKMQKATKQGYLSAILNLQPAYWYAEQNTCKWAGRCKAICLQHCGRNKFDMSADARIRKTHMYYDNPAKFYSLMIWDIDALIRKANREGLIPTVRLNGLSDIRWQDADVLDTGKNIFELYPNLQFIDYTKEDDRLFESLPENYHLTYSINEKTIPGMVRSIYKHTRFNAAQVFVGDLPAKFKHDNKLFTVIDGDDSDLRHLDTRQCIVGLRYKRAFVDNGKAYRPTKSNGFLTIVEA
jgi:hypothetical protein